MPPRGYQCTILEEIYTSDVLSKIAHRAESDEGLRVLHRLLVPDNEHRRIERVHFDRCLQFAKQHNGIDEDRLVRLRDPANYGVWKAVHNELLVPYFFAKCFKLKVKFITNAKEGGLGDFQVLQPEGVMVVEVKTPKGDDPDLQGPKGTVHAGLDEGFLRQAFVDGARQLKRGRRNLIVICTQLCAWIHDCKPLEKLFYGQEVITTAFDPHLGRAVRPVRTKFVPNGELHKHIPKRFTRVSAIAAFRNDTYCGAPFCENTQQVQFTVLHNYFACLPISPSVFTRAEQFIPDKATKVIKHVNEKGSARLIYSAETEFADFILRLTNCVYTWLRKARRCYYRLKMRRVAKSIKQGLQHVDNDSMGSQRD